MSELIVVIKPIIPSALCPMLVGLEQDNDTSGMVSAKPASTSLIDQVSNSHRLFPVEELRLQTEIPLETT